MIKIVENRLYRYFDGEVVCIEAWGENSLRTRAFPDGEILDDLGALDSVSPGNNKVKVCLLSEDSAEIVNGKIRAVIDARDRITYYNEKNEILLKEFIRLRAVLHDDGSEDASTIETTKSFNSTLKLKARAYKADLSGKYEIITRFESVESEKIFGMGQYQHDFLNLKNTKLELAQRNSQISIPFYLSNLGYGFLWNNPGIGEVTFAKNITEWKMFSTNRIDYWITAGDTPAQIEEQYANVTGKVPMMPKRLLGLWQSKLRYRTQEEVLEVANQYKKRGIQLSSIAIDYFHWPKQGEYQFDCDYWPNPLKMVKQLKKQGISPLISIWPTVQSDATNYNEYLEKGYLVKVNRGVRMTMQIQGNTVFVDMTNRKARDYVWKLISNNYLNYGIEDYWLDVAEPGYSVYDFDNYKYSKGTNLEVGNFYPLDYLKMIYYGLVEAGKTNVVTLVRGAWAGAQKYGALAWSGDIDSSFEAFRNQINTGLNVGISGLPWWTTDIGGFHGGNPEDKEFRELMIRWFQYATFSPILRMHGDRQPHSPALSNTGGGSMVTGASNEIWAYGEEAEEIMTTFIRVREHLKKYISNLMKEAHEFGTPLMRTLFYEFPEDSNAWEVDNTYLFGSSLLIAPVLNYQETAREVYLPAGETWINLIDGKLLEGGKTYIIAFDIKQIPVFVKNTEKSKKEVDFEMLQKIINQ